MSKETREIHKVKYDGKKVCIDYTVKKEDGKEEMLNGEFPYKPLKSFTGALAALAPHAIELVELTLEKPDSFDLRSISMKRKKTILVISMSGVYTLEQNNKPLNLNVPEFAECNSSGDDHGTFSAECLNAVNVMIDETKRYLDGYRETQPTTGDLFQQEEETKPDALTSDPGQEVDDDDLDGVDGDDW